MAGGLAACEPPRAWPEHDLLLVTLLGPAGAADGEPLPLRWDAGRRRLVTSWTEVEL
jgi:hypothetical protein